jgi:hypothetical protein
MAFIIAKENDVIRISPWEFRVPIEKNNPTVKIIIEIINRCRLVIVNPARC